MLGSLIEQLDERVGDALERAVARHHERRLTRIGQRHVLEPGPAPATAWASGAPVPRPGNELRLLVDGETIVAEIVAALREARAFVFIAGWCLDPGMWVTDGAGGRQRLCDVLAETARHASVHVLLWAGTPMPVGPMSRGANRKVQRTLAAIEGVTCALDSRERPMHCHHEKVVVVDDRVAFVGGLDLTVAQGDRRDTSEHRRSAGIGWHDAGSRIQGPAVADVSRHLRMRWAEVTGGLELPELDAADAGSPAAAVAGGGTGAGAGPSTVQVLSTVPEKIYRARPRGTFTILESYLRLLAGAREFIYLENQFLWSPEICSQLVRLLERPPCDEFRLLMVLPSHAEAGADCTRGQLGVLLEADAGNGRVLGCCLRNEPAPGSGEPTPPQTYVHAKLAVVDDSWLMVGSANLNEHSLFNDTELNVLSDDAHLARALRLQLWQEHLGCDPDLLERPAHELFDEVWLPTAREQDQRRRDGLAPTARVTQLRDESKRTRRLLGPLETIAFDG